MYHLTRTAASCKAAAAMASRLGTPAVATRMVSMDSLLTAAAAPFPGQKLTSEHAFTKDELAAYSRLCGDRNPIHTQEEAAKCAGFDCCVVHGMLQAALFPALIGSRFPGARLAFETFNFRAPVFVGERIQVEVEVLKIDNENENLRIEFNTVCHKNENILVIDGSAIVNVPLQKCN
eukprot:c20916_g1_i1 orf=405-935(-)